MRSEYKRYYLIAFILLLANIFLSIKISYALFSDSSQSTSNTFSAADAFPTATPTPTSTPQIVINEFSSDGNNQKEWAELYNPSGASVDLSGWLIGNGALNDPLPAGSIISAGGYAVIIPSVTDVAGIPSSAATFQLSVNQIGNGFTDAGDAIVLKNTTSTIIDQLSYGTDTTIFPTPPASPGSGQSLARSPNGFDADIAGDWVIDSTPTIGQANL